METFVREGHDGAVFFIGPEVEHTPAFSKKTLFVVGKQDVEEIMSIAKQHKVPHIFMGANHSFNPEEGDPDLYWKNTVTKLLDKGFYVSIDYQAHLHGIVLKMFSKGVWQCRTFVPLLHVRIPNLEDSSPNLTVKFDDVNFAATNRGVWCFHSHELTDSNKFTGWGEYGTDVVIKRATVIDVADLPPAEALKKVHEVQAQHRKNSGVVIDTDPMGLDADAPSKLKPDPEEVQASVFVAKTPDAVADAYADGAKEDPLGKVESKKAKVKKVA